MRHAVAFAVLVVISSPIYAVTLTISGQSLVASGVTSGAQVAWFGIAYEPVRTHWLVRRSDGIVAAAGTSATITPAHGIPMNSVWFAVDLDSGTAAVATPSGSQFKPASTSLIDPIAVAGAPTIGSARLFLEILYARPHTDAWAWSGGDGGKTDLDPKPNHLLAGASGMADVSNAQVAPPTSFAKGDCVIAVDPDHFEYLIVTVGGLQ